MDICVARVGDEVSLVEPSGAAEALVCRLPASDLAGEVTRRERASPEPVRWVWADTTAIYPGLLHQGVRVARCVDLRLSHAILRRSAFAHASELATGPESIWDTPVVVDDSPPSLLDDLARLDEVPLEEVLAEHQRQRAAIAGSPEMRRLRLLTTAESVGALIAAELHHVGLPFDTAAHDALLTELLGPRPALGGRPARLEALADEIRSGLNAPRLNPDSQPALLRALTAAGLSVTSTRQWELERLEEHPAVTALLQYKKLARLLSANGWGWMQTWVHDGRFRPEYVPGGVVTGRWAARGGGALQLPKQIRSAVAAEPGWTFVVADAAQLEPRVLAAMAGDTAMAEASRGADLYSALVDRGVVPTRPQAKVAMLGALYGATTGEAGQLMPSLLRAFPRATGLVEQAAREGEAGRQVHTWLGRTSPAPSQSWRQTQRRAALVDASAADERAARRQARDWGRFTRNFVVQGTAAEWALCWLAAIRRDLTALASAMGPTGQGRPDLVYFLHDEIVVHTPAALAPDVAQIVQAAADEAGWLLFGDTRVEFALNLVVTGNHADAK